MRGWFVVAALGLVGCIGSGGTPDAGGSTTSSSSGGSTGGGCPDAGFPDGGRPDAGCQTTSTGGSGSSGSGTTGSTGSSTGGSSGTSFLVSASPWVVEDHRMASAEPSGALGSVSVFRNGATVTGATVTLNGTSIPPDSLIPGFYDITGAPPISNLGPGQTLTLVVSEGSDSVTTTTTCPAQVAITAPSEGASLTGGTQLDVTWDQPTVAGSAIVGFWHYETEPPHPYSGPFYAEPGVQSIHSTGVTSATFTTPGGSDGGSPLMIQLVFPGLNTVTDHGGGRSSVFSCSLARRVAVSVSP